MKELGPVAIESLTDPKVPLIERRNILRKELNRILTRTLPIYEKGRFAGIKLRPQTYALLAQYPSGSQLVQLNRLLLEDAYPMELERRRPSFSLMRMRMNGNALFEAIQFSGQSRFDNANFDIMVLRNCTFNEPPYLTGMQVRDLEVEGGDKFAAIRFLENGINGSQALPTLEQSFKSRGLLEEADEAHIAAEEANRKTDPWLLRVVKLVFLKWLTSYGRNLTPISLLCLAFLAAGAWLFRRDDSVIRAEKHKLGPYNCVWYSFDAFLPGLDLGVYKAWQPRENLKWHWVYLRVHTAAGWVLVPLLIAAMAGLFH
jgi:hypothetical protein